MKISMLPTPKGPLTIITGAPAHNKVAATRYVRNAFGGNVNRTMVLPNTAEVRHFDVTGLRDIGLERISGDKPIVLVSGLSRTNASVRLLREAFGDSVDLHTVKQMPAAFGEVGDDVLASVGLTRMSKEAHAAYLAEKLAKKPETEAAAAPATDAPTQPEA